MNFRKPFNYQISKNQFIHNNHDPSGSNDIQVMVNDDPKTRSTSGSSLDGRNAAMEHDSSSYKFWQDNIATFDHVKSNNGSRLGLGGDSFNFVQHGEKPLIDESPKSMTGTSVHRKGAAWGGGSSSEEITLEVVQESEDISRQTSVTATATETARSSRQNSKTAAELDASKEVRVSFKMKSLGNNGLSGSVRSGTSSPSTSFSSATMRLKEEEEEEDEVVRCSSNMTFLRKSELVSRAKARSRLMDPPDEDHRNSSFIETSDQLRSGLLGRQQSEFDEEDDTLGDEDIPEEYRKSKFDTITLLQWLSLIAIISSLACSLSITSWKNLKIRNLHLWKWEVLLLVLICGKLVSGLGIRIIVFFIERNFLLRKKFLYFVYGVRTAVQNCLWLGLVLLSWRFLIDKKVSKNIFLYYVTKILICFLIATFLWLIKTLVVKVLASSFHVSAYFDRIQEALFSQYVIESLSRPPLIELSRIMDEEEDLQSDVIYGAKSMNNPNLTPIIPKRGSDNGITMEDLHRMNQKNVSAWNMKRLMKLIRNVSLTTLDEQTILRNSSEDESIRQIRSEKEAKAVARKIFKNVAVNGTKHIYVEDLMRFLREDEAIKTMSLFEGAMEAKKISKSALKNWLVNTLRERRALALTLNDTKTAINKLHHMISFLTAFVIIIIWLILLDFATTTYLLFLNSQIVLLAFMFGNSLKTVFESIIYLFVIHPYDVGDRLEIDSIEMIVEEMNILTTVFLRYDNLKVVYPNILLWQKGIYNYNRSPDMGDSVDFCLHITTPLEKINTMKQKILSYIDSKPEHWYSPAAIILMDLEGLNLTQISIWLRHKINHQDMYEKFKRKSLLIEEVIKILQEIDIDQHRFHPLDVNVKTMPQVVSNRVPPGWSQNNT